MRQLDHPNIIKLLDFSESRQYYYIVLELAPGGELFHQIVRLTYFSEELSRHVIVQVAKALEYLHEEKGVVHRYVPNSSASRDCRPLLTSFASPWHWLTTPQRHQAREYPVQPYTLCPFEEPETKAAG